MLYIGVRLQKTKLEVGKSARRPLKDPDKER